LPGRYRSERAYRSDLDRSLEIEPKFLSEDDHEHVDAISSVAPSSEDPICPELFMPWLRNLTAYLVRRMATSCPPAAVGPYNQGRKAHLSHISDHAAKDWNCCRSSTKRKARTL
jgi:hypothetical protein